MIQKAFDPGWHRETVAIYRDYTIYHQSRNAAEQAVFDGQTGQPSARSARLLERLTEHGLLRSHGRLLDVGCGNGAFLRAASQILPDWRLAGVEIDEKYKDAVETIPGVEALYACAPGNVPGPFHVITMIHALEHIAAPVAFLQSLAPSLGESGVIVLEVPNVAQNPFDLLVADHASHFTLASLSQVVEAAGYVVVVGEDRWVPKELTVVARPHAVATRAWHADEGTQLARRRVDWLKQTVGDAQHVAARTEPGRFGLFGTSIAGTWLGGELASRIGFYVDEDENRIGQQFMNRPIVGPGQLGEDAHVFVGLAPTLARAVAERLRTRVPGLTVYEPRALDVTT